jgi:spore maturation protein SpmA/spore maturation protein SpmB
MNRIFFALVAIAFAFAAWQHLTWRPPGAQSGASAVRLEDGRALVVGPWASGVYDGTAWRDAAWTGRTVEDGRRAVGHVREEAALAALPGGDALVAGGYASPATALAWLRGLFATVPLEITSSAQVWEARRDRWVPVDPLPEAVAAPMVATLGEDPVIVGGEGPDGPRDGAWRFDAEARMWARLPRLPEARTQGAITVLADGDLLVVGGLGPGGAPASEALRLDADTLIWSRTAGPRLPRLRHALVTLPSGEVLLVGGENPDLGMLRTSEAWDPATGVWRSAGQMTSARLDPAVVALPDGRVVAIGGEGRVGAEGTWWGGVRGPRLDAVNTAEIRDVSGSWTATAPLEHARVGAVGMVVAGRPTAVGGGSLGASFLQGEAGTWSYTEPASPMGRMGAAMLDRAEDAVMKIVLPLIGGMTLFLGAMKVAEEGGLMQVLARLIRPIMIRLFPDVPPDHPAMGAMILNMAANALGLGNAATPFGIRAMEHLDTLNPQKGTATNAMALFLAINTSNVTLLPTGVIVLRAINGSADPGGILVTTLFATICSTTVAIVATKLYQAWGIGGPAPAPAGETAGEAAAEGVEGIAEAPPDAPDDTGEALPPEASQAYPGWVSGLAIAAIVAVVPLAVIPATRPGVEAAIPWIIPTLIAGLLTYGWASGVPVYETFVAGAKDGWNVAVKIIPFLVGILVVIAMLDASGAMGAFTTAVGPWTSIVGLPAEALPMALLRPLSGSGAMGVMIDTISDPAVGPDSYTGYLVSTFQGSTETTFYVIAVYFGAVGVRRLRHSLPSALTADVAGVIGAVIICTLLYGSL